MPSGPVEPERTQSNGQALGPGPSRSRPESRRVARRNELPLWSAANLLTASRLALAALVWISPESGPLLLALVALAALSDVMDGTLARRARRLARAAGAPADAIQDTNRLGAWLDPTCDKLFFVSILGALLVGRGAPPWWLGVVAARELLVGPIVLAHAASARLRARFSADYTASAAGKATTVAQFVAVVAFLVIPNAVVVWVVLGLGAGALGTLAVGWYVARAKIGARERSETITLRR